MTYIDPIFNKTILQPDKNSLEDEITKDPSEFVLAEYNRLSGQNSYSQILNSKDGLSTASAQMCTLLEKAVSAAIILIGGAVAYKASSASEGSFEIDIKSNSLNMKTNWSEGNNSPKKC